MLPPSLFSKGADPSHRKGGRLGRIWLSDVAEAPWSNARIARQVRRERKKPAKRQTSGCAHPACRRRCILQAERSCPEWRCEMLLNDHCRLSENPNFDAFCLRIEDAMFLHRTFYQARLGAVCRSGKSLKKLSWSYRRRATWPTQGLSPQR